MKSYKIHLIRHGLTDSNTKGQYVGVTDVPLSYEGTEKLRELYETQEYPRADVFYTSPLIRCIKTCNILYPEANPIVINGLHECNFGAWEGKTAEELSDNPEFINWLDNTQQISPPGGESGLQFAKRVFETFENLVQEIMKNGTTDVAVVTHGGVMMTLLARYGLPKAEIYDWLVDNGCGYSIRITPGLWMRDKVAEVYAKIPIGFDSEASGGIKNIVDIARETSEKSNDI